MRDIDQFLTQQELFSSLSQAERTRLANHAKISVFSEREVIIREGEASDTLYLILEGKVGVYKGDVTDHNHLIAILSEGEFFGDMSLVDGEKRSATIVTISSKSALMMVNIREIENIPELNRVLTIILSNLAKTLSKRLRTTNEVVVANLRERVNLQQEQIRFGTFTVVMLAITCFYMVIFPRLFSDFPRESFLPIYLIGAVYSIGLYITYLLCGLTLSDLGLKTKNIGRDCWFAIKWTVPALFVMTLLKVIVMLSSGDPFLDNILRLNFIPSSFHALLDGGLYLIQFLMSAFIQELMTRGLAQNCLQRFLIGYNKWVAIFIANLLFVSMHVHMGYDLVIITFFPGLFWGWMFAKSQSTYAVTLSHCIVSFWAFTLLKI